VAEALAHFHSPQSLQTFIQALNDPDEIIRMCAARTLGQFREPDAFVALKKALKDESLYVREYASEALGRFLVDAHQNTQHAMRMSA
jgi:HEAT repeat protein